MYLAKQAVEKLGAKKIALLYQNDDVAQPVHDVMKGYVESIGAELVADVPHTGTDTDYSPMASAIAKSKPDAVIAIGYPAALVKTKAATMASGVDVPWLGPWYNASDAVVELDPKAMDGTYFNYSLDPFFSDEPEIIAFRDAMKKYFPDVAPSGLPLAGYAACQAFLEGFKEMVAGGENPTREGLVKALDGLGTREVGVIPAMTYNEGEHLGATTSYLIQWKDGEWATVEEPTEVPRGNE
jgi:ABC-type branched-subunit amino acid transport system substrate-binding protein